MSPPACTFVPREYHLQQTLTHSVMTLWPPAILLLSSTSMDFFSCPPFNSSKREQSAQTRSGPWHIHQGRSSTGMGEQRAAFGRLDPCHHNSSVGSSFIHPGWWVQWWGDRQCKERRHGEDPVMPAWAEPLQPACRAAFLHHSHCWLGKRVDMDTDSHSSLTSG